MPEENRGKYSAKSMSFALSDNYWGNGPLSRLPNNKPKSTGLNSARKTDTVLLPQGLADAESLVRHTGHSANYLNYHFLAIFLFPQGRRACQELYISSELSEERAFISSHCCLLISTFLGFEPSLGPTMPRCSISSTILAARA